MATREQFTHELATVRADLLALGQLAATAVRHAVAALQQRDRGWAQRVIAADVPIDAAAQRLEAHVFLLIATQQPVASDLRQLIAAITMSSELERIADYAKGIARIVVRHAAQLPAALPPDLRALSQQATGMLHAALAAFAAQDVAAATALRAADEVADALYGQLEAALIDQLQQDPTTGAWVARLLLAAHHLERVADRATNLAERVIFIAAGDVVDLNP
jgi:phosphate transport system protein